jgi:hypothetical protein
MAYVQKNNPVPKTGCGRRRISGMKNPFKFGIEHKGIDSAARGTKAIGPDGQPLKMKSPMKGKKDACYHKVKSRVDVWPSAYASGQLVQCRKAGAANWGTKSKK